MIAGKEFDLVIGVDTHIQMVPTPAPVPTPIPSVFVGICVDPMGLAMNIVTQCISEQAANTMQNAVGWAMSPVGKLVELGKDKLEQLCPSIKNEPPPAHGPVLVAGRKAVITKDTCSTLPFHLVMPPGALFSQGGLPLMLGSGDHRLGSSSVYFSGHRATRSILDRVFSCGDPINLPVSTHLPLPLPGSNVFIGGIPTPDIQIPSLSDLIQMAVTMGLRKLLNGPLNALLRKIKSDKWRNRLASVKCHITGDPVDVATGRVLSSGVEFDLNEALPFRFSREYSSASADRVRHLGYGWTHSFDQEIFLERGALVYQTGDSRQVVFSTLVYPNCALPIGEEIFEPFQCLWLKAVRGGFEVRDENRVIHEFQGVQDAAGQLRYKLNRVRSPEGRRIELQYDAALHLVGATSAEGRQVRFENTRNGMVYQIWLPRPDGQGEYCVARFDYDERQRLVGVFDALGHGESYEYKGNLMVRKTDREGLSFYFVYDGSTQDAWCIRTWGDGGLFDHELSYDKVNGRTAVTDSLDATSLYVMNEQMLVTSYVNSQGASTLYEYDEVGRLIAETDTLGNTVRSRFDDFGNCVESWDEQGRSSRFEYDAHHFLVAAHYADLTHELFERDSCGRVVNHRDRTGDRTAYRYEGVELAEVCYPDGTQMRIRREGEKGRRRVVEYGQGISEWTEEDALGRVIRHRDCRGTERYFFYDLLGELVRSVDGLGQNSHYSYDKEQRLSEVAEPDRRYRLRYGNYHKVVALEEAGVVTSFEYDTETRLRAVVNEKGERHEYKLGQEGEIVEELSFDGRKTQYTWHPKGQLLSRLDPNNKLCQFAYGKYGELLEEKYQVSSEFVSRKYDDELRLIEVENEQCKVLFERDAVGRIVAESQDGGESWVRRRFGPGSRLEDVSSDWGAGQGIEYGPLGDVWQLTHRRRGVTGRYQPGSYYDNRMRFERDAGGLEISRHLPGDLRLNQMRDAEGRVFHRALGKSQNRELPYTGLWKNQDNHELRLAHSLDSRRLEWKGQSQLMLQQFADGDQREYDYDSRGGLIRERMPMRGAQIERALDATRNLFRTKEGSDRAYGPGGRVLSADGIDYEYDACGRRTKKTEANGGQTLYSWNSHGHLVEVLKPDGTKVEMRYDAFSRRVSKTVTRPTTVVLTEREEAALHERLAQNELWTQRFGVLDSVVEDEPAPNPQTTEYRWNGLALLQEREETRDAEKPKLRIWYSLPGSHVPVVKQEDGAQWSVITDHLGTPTELYHETGYLAWRQRLNSYGEPEVLVGREKDCLIRFQGQMFDPDVGEVYNHHRWYDAHLGQYTSPDPIGLHGGLRAYGYVDDPNAWVDPWGLASAKCKGEKRPRWKVGDDIYAKTRRGEPSWSTVRARFWKNEAKSEGAVVRYGTENIEKMQRGRAPQRFNPRKGGTESMELSHEPIPMRDGGRDFVPRWPEEHARVDPYRRLGY